MARREKAAPFDGLGTREREKIASAIRQVWYRCKARAVAVKRCTDKDGFTRCEKCGKRTPKIKIDHIIPCGPVDSDGFIKRLFCPSSGLQCLCKKDHDAKTKAEKSAPGLCFCAKPTLDPGSGRFNCTGFAMYSCLQCGKVYKGGKPDLMKSIGDSKRRSKKKRLFTDDH